MMRRWGLLAGLLAAVLIAGCAASPARQVQSQPAAAATMAPLSVAPSPVASASPVTPAQTQPAAAGTSAAPAASPSAAPSAQSDDPALGPASAPVTLIEFGDFGCSTCQAWEAAGVPQAIRQEYGARLRYVWRDFPVTTPLSPKAAEAGRCAYDQNKFWEYHDLLYARAPALSVSDLKSYASELGLDAARFNQCLDSGQYKPTVDNEWQAALQLGFRSTPDFLINNQRLEGAPTLAYLKSLINQKLAGGS